MKVYKPEVDRKRAAAGESSEDASMTLGPHESLAKSLKPAIPPKSLSDGFKAPVWPEILSFGYSQERLVEVSRRSGHAWRPQMSIHIHPDREIIVGYSSATTSLGKLAMGMVYYKDLSRDNAGPLLEYVNGIGRSYERAKRLTMRLHRVVVDRERILLENSVPYRRTLVEMSVYSKSKVDPASHPLYLGKVKMFFPANASKMEVFINLDTL